MTLWKYSCPYYKHYTYFLFVTFHLFIKQRSGSNKRTCKKKNSLFLHGIRNHFNVKKCFGNQAKQHTNEYVYWDLAYVYFVSMWEKKNKKINEKFGVGKQWNHKRTKIQNSFRIYLRYLIWLCDCVCLISWIERLKWLCHSLCMAAFIFNEPTRMMIKENSLSNAHRSLFDSFIGIVFFFSHPLPSFNAKLKKITRNTHSHTTNKYFVTLSNRRSKKWW